MKKLFTIINTLLISLSALLIPGKILKFFLIALIFFMHYTLFPFKTNHFYRAAYLPQEPRFEQRGLTTLDIQLSEGKAFTAFNKSGDETPLFSLFSCDKRRCFKGTFELFETWITFSHTLFQGFFLEYTVPVTQFFLKPFSNCQKESEYLYLYNCCSITNSCELFSTPNKRTALSDCITLFGWTTNYEGCEELDFIDATIKTGVLWPTGTCIKTDGCLSIPNGYGNWGFPLSVDLAFGALDWLTLGLHLDTILFLSSSKYIKKQASCYNYLDRKPGTITTFSMYSKADHVILNLSLILGYTYSHKSKDEITQLSSDNHFNNTSNFNNLYYKPFLNEWSMHTIHIAFNYDFAREYHRLAPSIEIFFNQQVAGRNVFKTDMAGGTLGATVQWHF